MYSISISKLAEIGINKILWIKLAINNNHGVLKFF